MEKTSAGIKKKLFMVMIFIEMFALTLCGRVFYIQAFEAEFLQTKAFEQQTRDRLITANRGGVYDRNMVALAVTETVSSVSVIRAQIKDAEYVSKVLSERLGLDYDEVYKKATKRVALERIKTKVPKETADEIRALNVPGIIVDDDVKRVYPYGTLASQIIGFVGKDNQGIIGLEAKYDRYLAGEQGKILTQTDGRGVEIPGGIVVRKSPVPGGNLVLSLDVVLQQYAEQTIKKAVESKSAKRGLIILMNPQNGELYAMANEPGFDLNEPFAINSEELAAVWDGLSEKERNDYLNQMWRNFAINDTYEPGSTFKTVTSAAGLQEGAVTPESAFVCTGSKTVGGRTIKCWRSPRSHGAQTFVEGVQNSCNPVFMEIAERLGAEKFYEYLDKFGFNEKTGVDLPGEAVGIMHKPENVGPVELATMSFGQSFQITPLQLLRAACACVNGGYLVTPHFGISVVDSGGNAIETFGYEKGERIISEETSETMKAILESVVDVGTGNRTYIPGYRIGGKTATSEKLPRHSGKYIASFMAFAPAENPQVAALVLIDEPQGAYYGGQVAGPVMKELLETALPYLAIDRIFSEKEQAAEGVIPATLPDFAGMELEEARKLMKSLNITYTPYGEGSVIVGQFPPAGEVVNQRQQIMLYFEEE